MASLTAGRRVLVALSEDKISRTLSTVPLLSFVEQVVTTSQQSTLFLFDIFFFLDVTTNLRGESAKLAATVGRTNRRYQAGRQQGLDICLQPKPSRCVCVGCRRSDPGRITCLYSLTMSLSCALVWGEAGLWAGDLVGLVFR